MGTLDGYRSLGWDDGGLIAERPPRRPRRRAPRQPAHRRAAPRDRVLYAATSADVTDVVVHGEHVVRDGRHRAGDVGRLLADAIAAVRVSGGDAGRRA